MEVYERYLISQGRIKYFGALLRSRQCPPVAQLPQSWPPAISPAIKVAWPLKQFSRRVSSAYGLALRVLTPSEAILQGRYQLVIGKPPQCWQRDTVFLARPGVDQSLLRSRMGPASPRSNSAGAAPGLSTAASRCSLPKAFLSKSKGLKNGIRCTHRLLAGPSAEPRQRHKALAAKDDMSMLEVRAGQAEMIEPVIERCETPRADISVKSESPSRPGASVYGKITSRSGPCCACHLRIRRSRVRRTPGAISG